MTTIDAPAASSSLPRPTEEPEYLPLPEYSLEAKAKHEDTLRQLEAQKKARSLVVPTSDPDMKRRLRELGEPITLFGEGPGDRRERLRALLLKLTMDGELPLRKAEEEKPKEREREDEEEKYPFYTEGPPELRKARLKIARSSVPLAHERIAAAKKRRVQEDPLEEEAKMEAEVKRLRTFVIECSQIGDERYLQCGSFAPSGAVYATGSVTSLIKLWSIPSCNQLTELRGHRDRVNDISFHPNSGESIASSVANLVSCGIDGLVNVWSLDQKTPLRTLEGHEDRVNCVRVHPSGLYAGSTSHDKTWRLWDLKTGQELLLQEGHTRPVYAMTFQPDGALVMTGDLGGVGRVWDLRTGRAILTLQGHVKQLITADWHPNSYMIATGSDDNTVRIWDIRKKKAVYTIPAHSKLISRVKFNHVDNNVLLTSSYDHTVKLWNPKDWSIIKTLAGHEDKVSSVDISRDGKHIISTSFDKTFKLWKQDFTLLDLPTSHPNQRELSNENGHDTATVEHAEGVVTAMDLS
eukprot:GILK01004768.1.p1 GENE.GILK01004768.1~~GILK01004768.1.p1  ORF type:complete len:563 (-),score=101.60 GILK01004768.1:117-1679(-)